MTPNQATALISGTYSLNLSPATLIVWRGWFSQIPESELDSCLQKACEECTRANGPTPPEVVGIWKKRQAANQGMDADVEFNRALAHCERYGAEMFGGEPALQLSAAGAFALRSVGWRAGVMGTKEENTHWLKKNWIEAFNKYKEAERDGHALSEGETRKLLEMVKAVMPQLPAAAQPSHDRNEVAGVGEIVSTLRDVADEGHRKFHERPVMTDEERRDREDLLKSQLVVAGRVAGAERKS